MQVKGCVNYVSVSSPLSTYQLDVPVSNAASTYTVFSGSSYFSTTDATNCAITLELRTASPDAVYSGSWVTMDASGTVKVNLNTLDDQTFYIKATSGISNSFTQNTNNFRIYTTCTAAYTIT